MRTALLLGALLLAVSAHAQSHLRNSCMTVEAHHNLGGPNSDAGSDSAIRPPAGTTALSSPRVSTGVIGPRLISEPPLKISAADFEGSEPGLQHLVVAFTVGQDGKPKNVRLLKPVNPALDVRILCAVRRYRFAPATLNDQKIAMDIQMTINFEMRQRR